MSECRVAVVNGFHRTGTTRVFYAVQSILDALGIPFRSIGSNLGGVDEAIGRHLAGGGREWLTVKSHRWMPVKPDPQVAVLYTTRNYADVARSLIDLRLRRARIGEGTADMQKILGDVVPELIWQGFFNRYCVERFAMTRLPYETFYGRDEALIRAIAQPMGLALAEDAVSAIAEKIAVGRVKHETDAMTADHDPVTQFRKLHVSDALGAPNGRADDLPDAIRNLLVQL